MAKKRRRMGKKASKKLFTKTAQKVHPKNHVHARGQMRGGIRL